MNQFIKDLEPGDIFCTKNPMWLGRAICWFEKIGSRDNHAEYSHAGIILDRKGTTFEAVWTNKRQNLFRAYAGQKVLIGRHEHMKYIEFNRGWTGVKKYEGKRYAGWRLLLHAIPLMSKFGTGNFAVCSELAMKFISKSTVMLNNSSALDVAKFIRDGESICWKGWNPDDVADMIKGPLSVKGWSVVFEGKLPEKEKPKKPEKTGCKHPGGFCY